MAFITCVPGAGLADLRARVTAAALSVNDTLRWHTYSAVQNVAARLGEASPVGVMEGAAPPAGDGPGRLRDSFVPDLLSDSDLLTIGMVSTLQPLKLRFVRYGTGIYGPIGERIYPRQASALSWIGPNGRMTRRSVAGMRPNDFVSPVLAGATDTVAIEMWLAQLEIMAQLRG